VRKLQKELIESENTEKIIIKLNNKDCIEGMETIGKNSIDLVVTSPPYNIGIDYGEFKDKKEWSEYESFIKKVFDSIHYILKDNSIFAITIGNQRNSGLPHYVYFWLQESGFKIIKEIFWYKGLYYIQGETIFVCSKSGNFNNYYNRNNGFFANSQFSTVWEIRYNKNENKNKIGHDAFFVEQIPINFIEISTKEGDIVLDPFMGSGTTAVACKKFNRSFIGFEINKEYCIISARRLNKIPERLERWL